jgi:hypothetical protein
MILNSSPHISQLKKQYPDIFAKEESEKRLYFATRMVLQMHASHRSKLKKRNELYPAAPTRSSSIITHSQKENQQSEVATKDLAPKSNQGVLVCDKSFLKRFIINIIFWQKLKSVNYGTPRSVPLSQSKRFRVGFEQNDHGMPESASSLSRSKPDITYDPNQYRDIHSFLGTSTPPMTHLMDAFINFGCINADFLLAISSWSSERIREVLDQLSLGPDDRQITEMDKFILENHFKEYFTQQIGKRGNSDL